MHDFREWQSHRGLVLDSVKGFSVIECDVCSFKHIIPIPTEGELQDVYHEKYYSADKPFYFQHYEEDLDWWKVVYSERYEFFEKELPAGCRRIIDVGSGPGFFLNLGKTRGWEPLGIEPSRQAAEYSRRLGLEIVNEFLSRENVSRLGQFDVVHMSQVLEHIPDPVSLIQLSWEMLAPSGILCVVVPNDYNSIQLILKEFKNFQPWWVAPPHHINYFDFQSLEKILKDCNFDVLRTTTTFPMEIFLLWDDNYVGNDAIGRAMHERRKKLELILAQAGRSSVKRRIYDELAAMGLGREIVAYGRKKASRNIHDA